MNQGKKGESSSNGIEDNKEFEIAVAENYKLDAKKKLGSGAFGDIYYGFNIKLNEAVAIKLESTKSKHPQALYESKIYMALQNGGNKHC